MNWNFWRNGTKPETITDRKYRLAEELAALSEEDAREVVRFARPKMHLAKNGLKPRRKEIANAE